MRYVIVRDDDVNGTTPPSLLERLYRPFLDRGMSVCLAAIPEVRTDLRTRGGELEVFVHGPERSRAGTVPIGRNSELLAYLRANPGFHLAMHGCHHEIVGGRFEFDHHDRRDIARRLERGLARFREAGLSRPVAFVAPQDQMSRSGVQEVMRRFSIVSSGYYDVGRIPRTLLASYLFQKKVLRKVHFRAAHTTFLTHPGCFLSRGKTASEMTEAIMQEVRSRPLTVVVSHHSEFFAEGGEDGQMVEALHALPDLFATAGVRVLPIEEAPRFCWLESTYD